MRQTLILFSTLCALSILMFSCVEKSHTVVEIRGEQFYINGKPTYNGCSYNGNSIEGLLMNARMVQGIFDDQNPETRSLFKYPDTNIWDPERNTREFIEAMPTWKEHGLLAFSLNLQGGSPTGYGNKEWHNSAFDAKGNIYDKYLSRLEKICNKANELGMVIILGYFYGGQDQYLENETSVINATNNITDWILDHNYKHIIVEINNEVDYPIYDHAILQPERVHELITLVKSKSKNGYRLLTSTSYRGGAMPDANVVEVADFILLHGNKVENPSEITQLIIDTRSMKEYTPMPIVFNEDDHYDFDRQDNNMANAIKGYASWGYFDFRKKGESFENGFQSIPADWKISSPRKKAFFSILKEITSGN